MVRRSYRITDPQDEKIGSLALDMGIDKEKVVQLALDLGLSGVEESWRRSGALSGVEIIGHALKVVQDESIKKSGAKSASAKKRS